MEPKNQLKPIRWMQLHYRNRNLLLLSLHPFTHLSYPVVAPLRGFAYPNAHWREAFGGV